MIHILLSLYTLLQAASPGTTAANFLKIPVGARPVGLGTAYTALADDVHSLEYNPSGLALLRQKEMALAHNQYAQGIVQEYLSYAHPLNSLGVLGLSLNSLRTKDIEAYDASDQPRGTVSASDMAMGIAWARTIFTTQDTPLSWIENCSVGAQIRYISERLAEVKGQGWAMDMGTTLKTRFYGMKLGASLLQTGTRLKLEREAFPIASIFRLGWAWESVIDPHYRLVMGADGIFPQDNNPYPALGMELWVWETLALRLGYRAKQDLGSGLSLGTGFKILHWEINYAFTDWDSFSNIHRIEVLWRFGHESPPPGRADSAGAERLFRKHLDKGQYYLEKGAGEKAALEFERALELQPENPAAQRLLKNTQNLFKIYPSTPPPTLPLIPPPADDLLEEEEIR